MDRVKFIQLHSLLAEAETDTRSEEVQKLFKAVGADRGNNSLMVNIYNYYNKKDNTELHKDFSELSDDLEEMQHDKKKRLWGLTTGILMNVFAIFCLAFLLYKSRLFSPAGFQMFLIIIIAALVFIEAKWIKNFIFIRRSFKDISAIEALHLGMILLAMTVHKCTEAGKNLKPDMLEGFLENEFHNEYETFTAVTSRV